MNCLLGEKRLQNGRGREGEEQKYYNHNILLFGISCTIRWSSTFFPLSNVAILFGLFFQFTCECFGPSGTICTTWIIPSPSHSLFSLSLSLYFYFDFLKMKSSISFGTFCLPDTRKVTKEKICLRMRIRNVGKSGIRVVVGVEFLWWQCPQP